MKFIFLEDEAQIKFSWKERFYVFFKGVFRMDYVNAKHMTNHFIKMANVIDMEKLKDGEVLRTFKDTEIISKGSKEDKFIY